MSTFYYQAIGRRYRRQDEIGTPFCVTVDGDTVADDVVTVRERDSMTQELVKVKNSPTSWSACRAGSGRAAPAAAPTRLARPPPARAGPGAPRSLAERDAEAAGEVEAAG